MSSIIIFTLLHDCIIFNTTYIPRVLHTIVAAQIYIMIQIYPVPTLLHYRIHVLSIVHPSIDIMAAKFKEVYQFYLLSAAPFKILVLQINIAPFTKKNILMRTSLSE